MGGLAGSAARPSSVTFIISTFSSQMETRHYAVTVRKTRNPVTQEHYLDYLDKISDYGEVANVRFEATRGLHCHFTLELQGKLEYSLLTPTKHGWNVKAVPVFNLAGWIRYSRKDELLNREFNGPDVIGKYRNDPIRPRSPVFKMPKVRLFA